MSKLYYLIIVLTIFTFPVKSMFLSTSVIQGDCPIYTKEYNAAKDSFKIEINGKKSAYYYAKTEDANCQFGLLPVSRGEHWGFMDMQNAVEVAPCVFDSVTVYKSVLSTEDDTLYLANVTYKGQDVKINEKGQFVFNALELSVYSKNGKKGLQYVNADGSIKIIITQPLYKSLKAEDQTASTEGYGIFIAEKDGKWGLVNVLGTEVLPFEYDNIFVPDLEISNMYCPFIKKGKKMGVCNKSGKILVPVEYDMVQFYATTGILEDGIIRFAVKLNKKEGMYEVSKGLTFPCIYDEVFFVDTDGDDGEYLIARHKKSIGLFPPPGSTKKIDEGYENILPLAEGLRLAKKNGKWGAVDSKSQVVVDFAHDFIKYVDYKYLWVQDKGKWGQIDKQGKYTIQPLYDDVKGQQASLISVMQNKKWGLVNESGEPKSAFIYSRLSYNFDRKIWIATQEKKEGILDENGQVYLTTEYDKINEIFDDYLIVTKGGLIGTIDHKGKGIIDFKYSKLSPMKDLYFSAKIKDKFGIIDLKGNTVIPFEFEDVYPGTGTNFVVQKEEKKGLYNKDGKMIIPILYDKIIDFKDGYAKAVKEGKSIWVDASGREYTENPIKKKKRGKQQVEDQDQEKKKKSEDD